jgi:CobQ-like glutamine amidotransferase family enzyme
MSNSFQELASRVIHNVESRRNNSTKDVVSKLKHVSTVVSALGKNQHDYACFGGFTDNFQSLVTIHLSTTAVSTEIRKRQKQEKQQK